MLAEFLTLFTRTSGFLTGSLWGGPPPLYILIVIQIYKIWYVFWKPFGSTSIICTKNVKFAKFQIFIAKSSWKADNVQKKIIAQIARNYTLLKSHWPSKFKYAKTFVIFVKLQIPFKGVCAKICAKLICKNYAICWPLL